MAFLNGDPIINQYKYFLNPTRLTRQDVEIAERNMHSTQRLINNSIHKFFYDGLIKTNSNNRIRASFFKWLGMCLDDNRGKAQEWSNFAQSPFLSANQFASDGFFLNLLDLMLACSMPFCFKSFSDSSKLLKINFTYASASFKDRNFLGFEKETKMIPNNDDENSQNHLLTDLVSNAKFNHFITECYYATNNLFRLAFMSLNQKIIKLNGELGRWQQTYHDLMTSNSQDLEMKRIKVCK